MQWADVIQYYQAVIRSWFIYSKQSLRMRKYFSKFAARIHSSKYLLWLARLLICYFVESVASVQNLLTCEICKFYSIFDSMQLWNCFLSTVILKRQIQLWAFVHLKMMHQSILVESVLKKNFHFFFGNSIVS